MRVGNWADSDMNDPVRSFATSPLPRTGRCPFSRHLPNAILDATWGQEATSKDRLYGAIARDDTGAVREVVASDPSVLAVRFLDASWLHLAAQRGRIGIMDVLVRAGLAVDEPAGGGAGTPLESAAGQGHYEACEWLLDHGADINHRLGASATPIFSAIFSQSLDLVRLFVERGADLGAAFGDPPRGVISYARVFGTPEIVAFLARRVGG